MPIVDTSALKPGELRADTMSIYNGLDCCVTLEVFEELSPLAFTGANGAPPPMYDFERSLQGPVLDMMLRGFKVDEYARQKGIAKLKVELAQLDALLQRLACAVWDRPLNPRSPKQLQEFFYGTMRLPEVWSSKKGVKKLSTDREALEKLELYFYARPIIATILAYRDVAKRLNVLETEVDSDGRMRTSYNIGGTETWRFSSSASAYGTGTNLQNITPELRSIFVADEGWKLCVIDLEQAESREVGRIVGLLFNDWSYLDACEAGDLHTTTCKLIWTTLPWTGDKAEDRKLADAPFYRHFSRRDMSKRGGHGSNYYGTPFTMARHLKVPTKLMEDFQTRYFGAFPGIPRWHEWTARQLQTTQSITNGFGATRHFFGRPGDDSTLREAIAFDPQSSTAIRTNLGLYQIWDRIGKDVQLLAQTHDSVSFQYRERNEAEIVPEALRLMEIIQTLPNGRKFIVPGEPKVGWNWGNYTGHEAKGKKELNLDGLKKWKGKDDRRRSTILERII